MVAFNVTVGNNISYNPNSVNNVLGVDRVESIYGFIKHYFGDGSARLVTDEYIMSNSAQNQMTKFENYSINRAQNEKSYRGHRRTHTDVTFESFYLFSIGDSSNFNMSANCTSNTCNFKYDLYDSFRDPLDIGIGLPGSIPYPIEGHWTKEVAY